MYFKDRNENDNSPVMDMSSMTGNCPLQRTCCQHFICSYCLAWGGACKSKKGWSGSWFSSLERKRNRFL